MSLDPDDEIVAVKQIPDIKDQLFILTSKGMMIRMASEQTKETLGKVTKGTRIMELRNPNRNGYSDEVIFVARLPSSLVDMNVYRRGVTPLHLSGSLRSLAHCGSRIAWPLRWIANPVVFHLGSSNLPCRAMNLGISYPSLPTP